MDDEIARRFEIIEAKIDKHVQDARCPQDGCRFMESKGSRAGGIANILSSLALLAFIVFEVIGGFL